ncbi:hypothetical protein TARUN_8420 [Trichoderma arundinaceum]|uniref:Uncharacterized protein n=1 Tax=Trichoderma arundinaceum TaxID=490622 RepID=A0A395NCL1_TRIAR|nr:hypothetical protein TARUN_8420 [Trichoderma arundinaceum]
MGGPARGITSEAPCISSAQKLVPGRPVVLMECAIRAAAETAGTMTPSRASPASPGFAGDDSSHTECWCQWPGSFAAPLASSLAGRPLTVQNALYYSVDGTWTPWKRIDYLLGRQ